MPYQYASALEEMVLLPSARPQTIGYTNLRQWAGFWSAPRSHWACGPK